MLALTNLAITLNTFHLKANLLHVQKGRTVAVLGPSGAGKSTLLNLIAGFLTPDSGEVQWHGRNLTHLPPGKRPIAMLFQDNNLFPHLRLHQNLALTGCEENEINDTLTEVGLEGMAQRYPGDISGGQQSRAALARMLLQKRPLWLMDEPFGALGPALKAEMLTLTANKARAQGATILFITHTPEDAEAAADDVLLVANHQAHPPVPTQTALTSPPPALAAYLGI